MKTAYFDCIAGASGDMILGALVDAGLPLETLRERLNALHLADFDLRARRVAKNAFAAVKVDVIVADNVPERRLTDIEAIVMNSDLAPEINAAITKGAIIDTVMLAVGGALWFATGELLWFIACFIVGSIAFALLLAQAGAFTRR